MLTLFSGVQSSEPFPCAWFPLPLSSLSSPVPSISSFIAFLVLSRPFSVATPWLSLHAPPIYSIIYRSFILDIDQRHHHFISNSRHWIAWLLASVTQSFWEQFSWLACTHCPGSSRVSPDEMGNSLVWTGPPQGNSYPQSKFRDIPNAEGDLLLLRYSARKGWIHLGKSWRSQRANLLEIKRTVIFKVKSHVDIHNLHPLRTQDHLDAWWLSFLLLTFVNLVGPQPFKDRLWPSVSNYKN